MCDGLTVKRNKYSLPDFGGSDFEEIIHCFRRRFGIYYARKQKSARIHSPICSAKEANYYEQEYVE